MELWIVLFLVAVGLIPSFLISWVAVGWVLHYARRLGLFDRPGERKIHSLPIPTGGGLGIWLGMVGTLGMGTLAVLLLNALDGGWLLPASVAVHLDGLESRIGEIWGIVACGTVLVALGLADDYRGLPWWLRLATEFVVAGVCVYFFGLQLTAFIQAPWLTGLLSVLWIVTLINSFNMLDNMDGLSGGVAAIAAIVLTLMVLGGPNPEVGSQIFIALLMLILVGSLVGFLYYNRPPARIFMGDAGSYWIGFWMAIGTLLATYTGTTDQRPHAVISPLVILAIPLYDTVSVVFIRLREGRSPFDGDKRHFSHRLVDLGMSKQQSVLTIYLAAAACSVSALLLPNVNGYGAMIVVMQTLLILCLICVLENTGRQSPD